MWTELNWPCSIQLLINLWIKYDGQSPIITLHKRTGGVCAQLHQPNPNLFVTFATKCIKPNTLGGKGDEQNGVWLVKTNLNKIRASRLCNNVFSGRVLALKSAGWFCQTFYWRFKLRDETFVLQVNPRLSCVDKCLSTFCCSSNRITTIKPKYSLGNFGYMNIRHQRPATSELRPLRPSLLAICAYDLLWPSKWYTLHCG